MVGNGRFWGGSPYQSHGQGFGNDPFNELLKFFLPTVLSAFEAKGYLRDSGLRRSAHMAAIETK
jgi:hypothetical protein